MSPTGLLKFVVEVVVQKVIFGGFDKNFFFFFLQITQKGEHIKNSKKNFLKSYFLMGLSSKG